MIDPKLPHNQLSKIPPLNVALDDKDVLIGSLSTAQAIASLNATIRADFQNITHSLNLMSPLYVPEAVASSSIENIITTNERIYQMRLLEESEISPQEKEVMRYTDALIEGMNALTDKGFLATNEYIKIQKNLEPNRSGIRKIPGTQLKNRKTGEVFYTPPDGEERLRNLLKNYELYFNETAPKHETFCRAAILHYQFEAIHPFHDGNGRTGRMLIPLYLTKQGVLDFPLLFVSKYILDNRDDYYQLLRDVTFKKGWKDWILYILKALEVQATYTLRILRKINKFQVELRQKLEDIVGHTYARDLAELLYERPYFVQSEVEKSLKVSYLTARKYLLILEKSGIVMKKKQIKRNRFIYICPEYVNLLKKA